ncbi:acyl-CoA thioesterase [Marivita sp.]|jgi:4-hydroxybenzoyl-CoA thioesterase|uniref:acyl-CoA thioesterase n=1 Tax=Marivita sp. TaxID=2003365 RepID=UPI003A878754
MTEPAFAKDQKVLFRHCDPAGIVFFPRYFEMMNDLVEEFFDEALGYPFEEILKTEGVPTAQIETRFVLPSYHGDLLQLRLWVTRLGTTSMTYKMTATCGDELRFETRATLVHVNSMGRPEPWPEQLRNTVKTHEARDDT